MFSLNLFLSSALNVAYTMLNVCFAVPALSSFDIDFLCSYMK